MAKLPDLSAAELTIVLSGLETLKGVYERAKRNGDPDVAEVYDRKLAALSVVRGKVEGTLL